MISKNINLKLAIRVEFFFFLDVFEKCVSFHHFLITFRIKKGYFKQCNYLNGKFIFCVVT